MKNALLILCLAVTSRPATEFRDDFDTVKLDSKGANGWRFVVGDGTATMNLRQGGDGFASIFVDATTDKRGIWWALVERAAPNLDVELLRKPGHELRIEARVRSSHAPRRVNLQVLTQRTTDNHAHLMELELPDTDNWHTVSMTTHGFHAEPGDTLIAHLAMMDWGLEKYRLDVDYIKLSIVDPATAGPDQGASVPYHPPVANPKAFTESVPVAQDSMIDLENTDVNFNDWSAQESGKSARKVTLLTVDGTHDVILRWDLRAFAGRKVAGHGLLELTTHAVQHKTETIKDFGQVRVVEILGGDPHWNQKTVTTDSFCRYQPLDRVLNTQMIIDWPVAEGAGAKTYLTISQMVLQRLIDGKSQGIAIKALGALSAGFYAMENEGGKLAARLRFNLAPAGR